MALFILHTKSQTKCSADVLASWDAFGLHLTWMSIHSTSLHSPLPLGPRCSTKEFNL